MRLGDNFGFLTFWKVRAQVAVLLIPVVLGCSGDLNLGMQEASAPLSSENQENIAQLNPDTKRSVRLDARTYRTIQRYGKTIKKRAREYGFDWRFVLAIMKQESHFIPDATSHRGAYGLMQLMPVTSYEVANALGYQRSDLARPRHNITGGIYYFWKVYDLFDGAEAGERLRLALAAYNAGPLRVYDAQDVAAYLGEHPHRWAAVQDALPLLSKRYYTLHQYVWADGRPRSGYFGDWKQTLNYVERVMRYYEDYRRALE